jgi:hypothetical protein
MLVSQRGNKNTKFAPYYVSIEITFSIRLDDNVIVGWNSAFAATIDAS